MAMALDGSWELQEQQHLAVGPGNVHGFISVHQVSPNTGTLQCCTCGTPAAAVYSSAAAADATVHSQFAD